MDRILALAKRSELEALAQNLTMWATIGAAPLQALVVQAEVGRQCIDMVVRDFRDHQTDFERHLKHAKLDTANLILGPVAALQALPDAMTRIHAYSNAVLSASSEPGTAWERVRQIRAMASAPAKDLLANLAKENPWRAALSELNALLGTCQLIVDLGLSTTDLVLMNQSIQQLHEVNRIYGQAFAASDTAVHMLKFLVPLIDAGERTEAMFDALDRLVHVDGAEFLTGL